MIVLDPVILYSHTPNRLDLGKLRVTRYRWAGGSPSHQAQQRQPRHNLRLVKRQRMIKHHIIHVMQVPELGSSMVTLHNMSANWAVVRRTDPFSEDYPADWRYGSQETLCVITGLHCKRASLDAIYGKIYSTSWLQLYAWFARNWNYWVYVLVGWYRDGPQFLALAKAPQWQLA